MQIVSQKFRIGAELISANRRDELPGCAELISANCNVLLERAVIYSAILKPS